LDGQVWAGGDDGQSAKPPGESEQIEVSENVPGNYVMRIVNYAAEGTTWTASVESFKGGEPAHYEEIGKETWTLTCESPDGKTVYETHKVFIERGQRVSLNLACGRQPEPTRGGNRREAIAKKIKVAKKKRARCVRRARKIEKAKKRRAAVKQCRRTYKRRVRRIRRAS
jgi:hypothetical protein